MSGKKRANPQLAVSEIPLWGVVPDPFTDGWAPRPRGGFTSLDGVLDASADSGLAAVGRLSSPLERIRAHYPVMVVGSGYGGSGESSSAGA